MREQYGHSKSSYTTTVTLASLLPRTGLPARSILAIVSACGSRVRSIFFIEISVLPSLLSRNSCFCDCSPYASTTVSLS